MNSYTDTGAVKSDTDLTAYPAYSVDIIIIKDGGSLT